MRRRVTCGAGCVSPTATRQPMERRRPGLPVISRSRSTGTRSSSTASRSTRGTMRRRSELLACVALAGCNTVFGLERGVPWDAPVDDGRLPADRDRDGIVDRDDPCIASITDFKSDLDFDGNPNETDHCPADFDTFDSDGDQIFDDCDPLPQFDNDRRRCFMSFPNPTLTRELWLPRGDATVWELVTFSSIV